jgi:hypothetical protein
MMITSHQREATVIQRNAQNADVELITRITQNERRKHPNENIYPVPSRIEKSH